ncbi:hypothetical protein Tco_1516485 [Tanacetum coccineum]
MAETMEQYMSKTRADYGSGIARPKIDDKDSFELKGQFLKELRDNTFSEEVRALEGGCGGRLRGLGESGRGAREGCGREGGVGGERTGESGDGRVTGAERVEVLTPGGGAEERGMQGGGRGGGEVGGKRAAGGFLWGRWERAERVRREELVNWGSTGRGWETGGVGLGNLAIAKYGGWVKEERRSVREVLEVSDHEDANEHIEKVLEIVDLFHIPNITQDQVMLRAFPMSLTRAVSHWLRNNPSGLITTWEDLKTKFLSKYCPPARTTKKMEEINNFQ